MNIDFHYGVIYLAARLAGMPVEDARIVAHACQYIDDATTHGVLEFVRGETFERFASAHRLFDYHNMFDGQNRLVWVPFHFLPGGQGDTLEEKSVCRPDSPIAQQMVKQTIGARHAGNALHRLGIALHVYVDTWAHQGFTGTLSKHNTVSDLEGDDHDGDTWRDKLGQLLARAEDDAAVWTIDRFSALGHGAALHFPDLPWAKWRYTNGHDTVIERDNLPHFIEAANMACKAIQGFLRGNQDYGQEAGFSSASLNDLTRLLAHCRDHDEIKRLAALCSAIENGQVTGIKEAVPVYLGKGAGSWKHAATGIADVGDGDEKPLWSQQFETSDYRKFHDAVKEHRFVVTQDILPRYGVRLV